MANLDDIISYLQGEGLMPSKDEDGDIVFKYQMNNYIIFDTPDDEPYLQIALPRIYDVTDDNLVEVLAACNNINRTMKVAKTIITGDCRSVWQCMRRFSILIRCMMISCHVPSIFLLRRRRISMKWLRVEVLSLSVEG